MVLRNADAAVIAEVGGRRLYQGREGRYTDFNRATQAMRQPGSALKPLVYAAALRAGASLDTVLTLPFGQGHREARDPQVAATQPAVLPKALDERARA